MNYTRIYEQLIEKARQRTLEGYCETHHILPVCIGGSNHCSNLVDLTPEEHYIAHLLLVKIHPKEYKLIYAANMMANRNNKSYGWIKRKYAEQASKDRSGYQHTQEARDKMSASRKDVPKSEEHKDAIRQAHYISLEYKGCNYKGYEELQLKTGVTRYLYLKYYMNGIDPVPYINNKAYGIIRKAKETPPMGALGKRWFNNGVEERYFNVAPDSNWNAGRLKRCTI